MSEIKTQVAYLIDTISCDTAGTQKQLLETVRRLDRDRFDPHIICLHSSPWMEKNELPCPVTVLGYRGFLKPSFPGVTLRLRRLVRQRPVHILQTFFEDSVFVAFLATQGLKRNRCILLSSRRDMGLGGTRPWYHALFALALPWVSRHFDGLVCNGQEIKNWVSRREKMPLDRIQVIHNGTALPALPSEVPELLCSHPAALWIGLVASLTPVKRIDVFLRALQTVATKRPDIPWQAVVLGEGPEGEVLRTQTREAGLAERVHFPGAVREVSPFLHHLCIGVLCSDREGFSNAVLEYMAHGLPVVVTAVGGNAELVDAASGLCVPAGDHEALADALIRLADDPVLRARLGAGGRDKVATRFSWDHSMAELEGYYSRLLARRPPATEGKGTANVG